LLSWGGGLSARLVQCAAIAAKELAAPRPPSGGVGGATGARLSAQASPTRLLVRTAQARFLSQGLALIVAHWPPHNSGVKRAK